MLYVKIMSSQDLADVDPWHGYEIVPVSNNETLKFRPVLVPDGQVGNLPGERFALEITGPDGETHSRYLTGNAYVMNEAGKTIATHGC